MYKGSNKIRYIIYFLKQYPGIYISLFLLTIFYSVLESVNISVFFPLLKSIVGGMESSNNKLFNALELLIDLLPFKDPFINTCILAMGLLIFREITGLARQALIGYGVGKVVCDTKERIFHKYATSDYRYFLDNRQGDLLYRLLIAPGRLGQCLQYIPQLATAILLTISIGILLLSISVPVTITLLCIGVVFNYITQELARRVSYHLGTERASVSSEANVVANEFIDGVKQIKVFGSNNLWIQKFYTLVRKFKELVIKDYIWIAIPERGMQILPVIVLISIAIVLRYIGASRDYLLDKLPIMSVYVFAFYRLVPYLTSFGRLKMQIMGTLADVELIHDLLSQKTTFIKDGLIELKRFNNQIEFKDVTFQHPGKNFTLIDINLIIPKGKITAIVGPSGSGKTTLIHLLLRLFTPNSGKILIDGIDIKGLRYDSLTNLIGLVSQETFIFNGSVKDNICFGLKDISFDEIVEAAKTADAHNFILSFPDGYETIVGDKGLKLSGGQRQRIAIARAVLRNPQILILDEATSSLDYNSEIIVQHAINRITKNRTVIVIAHRLSTIINSDKIIVLKDGQIVEEGMHRDLISKNGVYANLYKQQELISNQLVSA